MHILRTSLRRTKLRYVNIAWCSITAESVDDICSFIKENMYLEKLLMQHNEIYLPVEGDQHGNAAMRKVLLATKEHPSLKYLDISNTRLGSQNLLFILELQANSKVKLQNLQCRKNKIFAENLTEILQKLSVGKDLRVLNLKDNSIQDQIAHEILTHFAIANVYLDQVILKGNKCLKTSDIEHINDECRKNLLIQKHILPALPLAKETGYKRQTFVKKTCCNSKFDVRHLKFEDVSFFSSDFIAKFLKIHKQEVLSLRLINVHTDLQLRHLFVCLKNAYSIQTLHIENCIIRDDHLRGFLDAMKTNMNIKSLSFVNMRNMQKYLRLMYISLKKNTTLMHLCLEENEIDNYKYINKIIQKNHHIRKLDLRGNYMNLEILEQLWDSLKGNCEITELLFDQEDNELDPLAITSVDLQLKINEYIQSAILSHFRVRLELNP